MGSPSQRRRSAGVLLLAIAFALTVASTPVAAAPPIEPQDFPVGLCTERNEGQAQPEFLNPNTSDYVVWRCSQYDSQDLYYWKIDDFGTANEKLGEPLHAGSRSASLPPMSTVTTDDRFPPG